MVTKSLDLVGLSLYQRADEPHREKPCVQALPLSVAPPIAPMLTKHKHKKPYIGVLGR